MPLWFTTWLNAFITACLFLTRLPMPTLRAITPEDQGRALTCFPLVGIVIGTLLWLSASILNPWLSPLPLAAVILVIWIVITGGLHLDGLADSADGWLAGGNKERTLAIIKDPRCGSAGVIAISALLLVKFSALVTLLQLQQFSALLLAPVIGRIIGVIMTLMIPPAMPNGIAQHYREHAPGWTLTSALITGVTLLIGFTSLRQTLILCAVILLSYWLLQRLMVQRLDGATGDTIGGSIEVIEGLVLLTLTLGLD